MAASIEAEAEARHGFWRLFFAGSSDQRSDENHSNGWRTAFGIPVGTPFVLSPDFRYDCELNEFFFSADMLPTSMLTRIGYARDLTAFLNFLSQSRAVSDWRASRESDHLAYLVWRRQDPNGPQVSGATWDRELSALNRFFRWQTARGRVPENPIPQKSRRGSAGSRRIGSGETPATYSHDARRENVHWVPAASYRRWRDVGLRGYGADGLPRPSFRGRWASRNATFADLMVRTGLRLSEQASLLVAEVPLTTESRFERFRLAEGAAKGGSGRWVRVPSSIVRDLATYVSADRAEIVRAAQERDSFGHGLRPMLDVDSGRVTTMFAGGIRSRVKLTTLSPEARVQLFIESPEGREPAALWLTERGSPMARATWKDLFRQANDRCRSAGLDVHVHAHMLRHTFAVLTLEQLQRGHIKALAELSPDQRTHYVRIFGDPLDWVRRALGHRSVVTTQIYLHALEELEMETRIALVPNEWETLDDTNPIRGRE